MNKNGFFSLIREAGTMTQAEKEIVWRSLQKKISASANEMSHLETVIQFSKLVGGVIIILLLTLIYFK